MSANCNLAFSRDRARGTNTPAVQEEEGGGQSPLAEREAAPRPPHPRTAGPAPTPAGTPTRMTDAELLDLAARLAAQAGHAILGVRRAGGVRVERKSDRSPVTQADRIAEALIAEGLRAAAPDIPIVAEEEYEAGIRIAPRAALLAGGRAGRHARLRRGRDEYAVCIGLVVEGRAHLGALALPAFGEVFGGCAALGTAWKGSMRDAARRPIAVRAEAPAQGVTVLASRRHADDARLGTCSRGRRGRACRSRQLGPEVLPRGGGARPTSTRASARPWNGTRRRGQALVEAAGGAVETHWTARAAALRQAGLAEPRVHLPRRRPSVTERLTPAELAARRRAAAPGRAGRLPDRDGLRPGRRCHGTGGPWPAIFAAKGRPHFNPLICHYPDADGGLRRGAWPTTAPGCWPPASGPAR